MASELGCSGKIVYVHWQKVREMFVFNLCFVKLKWSV